MADVKWIKIVTDIFDDEKIQLIDSLPERDGIIVIWFKLLCLAGKQNNGGVFMLNDKFPYTDEMLSTIFRRPLNTVRLALKTFQNFGMVEIVNNTITLPHWNKHQSLDKLERAQEKNRKRVAAYRERQKQKALAESNAPCNVTVTESNAADKEEEKEKEKEKNRFREEAEVKIRAMPVDTRGGDGGNNNDFSFLKKMLGEKFVDERKEVSTVDYDDPEDKLETFRGRVMFTEYQLADLLEKLPLETFEEYVDRLNAYIDKTGANIRNHYATILKWYNEDRAVVS